MRFTVALQDPFEQQEEIINSLSGDAAWQLFRQVDWEQLEKAVYERLDDVVHHLYFYEISLGADGDKRTLHISPGFGRDGDMPSTRRIFMVRYEYPHPAKPGRYLNYSYQQSDYAFAQDAVKAFIQGNRQFFTDQFETPRNKGLSRGKLFKKLFRAFLVLLVALLLFIQFVIGWNHVPEHLASVRMWLFPGSFENSEADEADAAAPLKAAAEAAAGITDVAQSAPQVLLDTVMWKAAIERGDFIPDGVKDDYERARHFDYTKLEPASQQPDNEEAQDAILHYYKGKVGELLKDHNAYIRIGKAYNAALRPDGTNGGEIARVTAMVCAFNKQGENLGNIQMPLDIAYDFVQYAGDPGVWYLADLSQTIPYDYVLMKGR
ncbi:hypothetical protein U0035_02810 [Niabella yanshanensis]|uniref:Uncharacterized protein n=1 Tax=Niabella yanshanensis TaxID=577386 RepID=A0ABZ0WBS6_9BACT|nr:hypothetical protein [Niabella yanshanensis]WQD39077.1 hypothetical protein U0035_02810 [Niabella yanshanensis]